MIDDQQQRLVAHAAVAAAPTIWSAMSATVISQADTIAAATRNITTAVVCAVETSSAVATGAGLSSR